MDYAEVLRDLETQFLAQLEREPAKGNAQVPGDAAVKQKLYALLGRAQLRRFFAAAVDGRYLSRIRSLFGAPPYYFINTGEALLFRAGGFAARTHMAGASSIPPSNQIVAQFVDQHDRGFSLASDEVLQWPEPRSGNFFFRLKSRRATPFYIGEVLTLTPTPLLQALSKKYSDAEVSMRPCDMRIVRVRHRLEDTVGASGMISADVL